MGLGDFKAKFGAEVDQTKYRWVRSRYRWLLLARNMAARGYRWQQAVRGRLARLRLPGLQGHEGDPDDSGSPGGEEASLAGAGAATARRGRTP
jgi:hypothetical protein